MALFVVTHRHEEGRCPAGDPNKEPMLVRRLSKTVADRFGVTIRAHAIIGGAHTLHTRRGQSRRRAEIHGPALPRPELPGAACQ